MSGTPVLIARRLAAVLAEELADLSMPVERQRTEPLAKDDLPRVLVHEDAAGAEEEYVGGASLRFLRFTVECVTDGDTPVAAQDALAVLRERVRLVLENNRLLTLERLVSPAVVSPRLAFRRAQAAGAVATVDDAPRAEPQPYIPLGDAVGLGLAVGPAEIRTELPEQTNARGAAWGVTVYHV